MADNLLALFPGLPGDKHGGTAEARAGLLHVAQAIHNLRDLLDAFYKVNFEKK